MRTKAALFNCPRCNAPITSDEYIGANFLHKAQYWHCKNCGEIIMRKMETK